MASRFVTVLTAFFMISLLLQNGFRLQIVSRIKVMARLNIAEKRLPQDGRIEVRIGSQNIDIRISTIPIANGERVVLRLLNKSGSLLKLTESGMGEDHYKIIDSLIRLPNGIILVTGPTGSGKTTSLYAILSEINRPDINIITIEDPLNTSLKALARFRSTEKLTLPLQGAEGHCTPGP